MSVPEVVTPRPAELECMVRSYGGARPARSLDPAVVAAPAALGAAIDIDLLVF